MANAKGTLVVQAVRALRSNPDRARELLPPSLHSYLSERILVTQWYPEEEYYKLVKAVAAMPDFADGYYAIGRAELAQRHFVNAIAALTKCRDAYGKSAGDNLVKQTDGTHRLDELIQEQEMVLLSDRGGGEGEPTRVGGYQKVHTLRDELLVVG